MKIGMVTDSLGHLSRDDMLDTAARLGFEFNNLSGRSVARTPLHQMIPQKLIAVVSRNDFRKWRARKDSNL